jgi:hypothetical protein
VLASSTTIATTVSATPSTAAVTSAALDSVVAAACGFGWNTRRKACAGSGESDASIQ